MFVNVQTKLNGVTFQQQQQQQQQQIIIA